MITCLLCGKLLKIIKQKHLDVHGVSRQDYKEMFPGASLWSEEYSLAQRLAQSGKKQSSETIEKRCSQLRGRKHSSERVEKSAKGNRGKKRTPEFKEKHSERTRQRYLDRPDICLKISKSLVDAYGKNPEWKEAISSFNKNRFNQPGAREEWSEKMREVASRPGMREKMSAIRKQAMANNPDRRKKMSEARIKSLIANPFEWKNRKVYSTELHFMSEAKSLALDFKKDFLRIPYTYEGQRRIYVPDFYLPALNMVVETKSWYWLHKQGLKLNEAKLQACIDFGYETIMIIDGHAVYHDGWLISRPTK